MKRLLFSLLWVVVTIIVFFIALQISSSLSRYYVKSDYAYIRPSEIVLNSPVESIVKDINVQSSEKVKVGDPLVRLNTSHLDTAIRVAKSEIKTLQLKQDFLMSLININTKLVGFFDHADGNAQHLSSPLSDEISRLNAVSTTKLHVRSVDSLDYLNQIDSSELVSIDMDRVKLKVLAKTKQFKLEYNQMQLEIDKAMIKIEALNHQRQAYTIRSPWSARVLSVITYPGEVVTRMQPLISIRSHSLDYVDAYFSIAHANQLSLGQKATVVLKGDKVHQLRAIVTDIGLQNQHGDSVNQTGLKASKGVIPDEYLVVLRLTSVPDQMKRHFKPGVPVTVEMD